MTLLVFALKLLKYKVEDIHMNQKLAKVLSVIMPTSKLRKHFRNQIKHVNYFRLAHVGDNVVIRRSAKLDNAHNIFLHNDCYIGENVRLLAAGTITIGDHVAIGERVIVFTNNHDYKSKDMFPYSYDTIVQNVELAGDNWIGACSIILPGVRIGKGAIVGAGSVVTKSVPDCAIVGGNPAKIIGWRDKENYFQKAATNQFHLVGAGHATVIEGFKPELKE